MVNILDGVNLGFPDGAYGNVVAILYILCGLGIFLFGINMMGSSLKAMAGDKMKVIIAKGTNTPIKGMLVGFVTTMLTQSASGTSALAVSLVGAGLMTFGQALGVLLGANIGGTILTIILAFFSQLKIMPIVSVVLVFIGATMNFFFKKQKVNQIGSVVLGFGFIFLGLALIDMSFKHFLEDPSINQAIVGLFESLQNVPVLGVIVGTLFTFVVQSSSATIGIVQELFAEAAISLKGALAIMLGANIGTTITALLASLGSNKTAKKVALANILIKLVGVLVFMCLFVPYYWLCETVANAFNMNGQILDSNNAPFYNPMIIALAHLFFNIVNSFVFLFLLTPLTFICNKLIKTQEGTSIEDSLLDYTLIQKSPTLAITFAKSALDYMIETMNNAVHVAKSFAFNRDEKLLTEGAELERTINCLDKRIHDYLIKLTLAKLDNQETALISKYLDNIKDIERIGDHCTNILEFFEDRYSKDMHLSEDGVQDLESYFGVLLTMVDGTTEAVKNWDKTRAIETLPYEDQIDQLEEVLHERHVHRVQSGYCSFMNTEHYVEILSNVERMGDHLTNILDSIIIKDITKYDEFNH